MDGLQRCNLIRVAKSFATLFRAWSTSSCPLAGVWAMKPVVADIFPFFVGVGVLMMICILDNRVVAKHFIGTAFDDYTSPFEHCEHMNGSNLLDVENSERNRASSKSICVTIADQKVFRIGNNWSSFCYFPCAATASTFIIQANVAVRYSTLRTSFAFMIDCPFHNSTYSFPKQLTLCQLLHM